MRTIKADTQRQKRQYVNGYPMRALRDLRAGTRSEFRVCAVALAIFLVPAGLATQAAWENVHGVGKWYSGGWRVAHWAGLVFAGSIFAVTALLSIAILGAGIYRIAQSLY